MSEGENTEDRIDRTGNPEFLRDGDSGSSPAGMGDSGILGETFAQGGEGDRSTQGVGRPLGEDGASSTMGVPGSGSGESQNEGEGNSESGAFVGERKIRFSDVFLEKFRREQLFEREASDIVKAALRSYLTAEPMTVGEREDELMQSLVVLGFRSDMSVWFSNTVSEFIRQEAGTLGGRAQTIAARVSTEIRRSSGWYAHDPYAPFIDLTLGQRIWNLLEKQGVSRESSIYIHNAGTGSIAGMLPESLNGIRMTLSEPEKIQEEIFLHAYFSGIPELDVRNSLEGETSFLFKDFYDASFVNVRTGLPRPGFGDTPDLMKENGLYYSDSSGLRRPVFAKDVLDALETVKPGGIVVALAHPFFMDYSDSINGNIGREEVLKEAALMGAIRLPQNRFRSSDEGINDLLVFRKRLTQNQKIAGEIENWNETVEINVTDRRNPRYNNSYKINVLFKDSSVVKNVTSQSDYISRPNNNGFGAQKNLEKSIVNLIVPALHAANPLDGENGKNLVDELAASLPQHQSIDPIFYVSEENMAEFDKIRQSMTSRIRHGSDFGKIHFDGMYVLDGGQVMVLKDSIPQPITKRIGKKELQKISMLIPVRDAIAGLVDLENSNASDEDLNTKRAELNKAYDAFYSVFGPVNAVDNDVLNLDPFKSLILSLEKDFDEEMNSATKEDIFFKRMVKPVASVEWVDLEVALSYTDSRKGGIVSYPEISVMTGMPVGEVIEKLKDKVFFDPAIGRHVLSSNYLSGNVREKIKYATLASRLYPGHLTGNIEALNKIVPAEISTHDIFVQLGSPWVPTFDIALFTKSVLTGNPSVEWRPGDDDVCFSVSKNSNTGWKVSISDQIKNAYKNNRNILYGTKRVGVERLIEHALNGSIPTLMTDKIGPNGYVVIDPKTQQPVKEYDEVATEEARAKIDLVKEMFSSWLRLDVSRMERLKNIYNEQYNSIVPKSTNPETIVPDGMIDGFVLRDYQLQGVARFLESGSTIYAYPPGAGKTAIIAKAIEQAMMLNIVKKPAIVLPGHIAKQFAREYSHLYPTSKILLVNNENFSKKDQETTMKMLRDGNFVTIYSASTFARIPCGKEASVVDLTERLRIVEDARHDFGNSISSFKSQADKYIENSLDAEIRQIQKNIDKAKAKGAENEASGVVFENFGHDFICLDEYHILTKNAPIPGLEAAIGGRRVSARAENILQKVAYIKSRRSDNHSILLSSGTPFTNNIPVESFTSLYFVMKQKDMEAVGVGNIRNYLSNFFEKEIVPQAGIAGSMTMVPRYTAIRNRQELLTIFDRVMSSKNQLELGIKIPSMNRFDVQIEQSEFEKRKTLDIAEKIDRSGNNMSKLRYTTDIAKLSVDERLIDPYRGGNDEHSLFSKLVDNVARISRETEDKRGTQLIFLDYGVPGGRALVNLYEDLRDRLVAKGMKKDEIVFIHEAVDSFKLVESVNRGEKRVLILPTSKGTGLNLHERGKAIHFASLPWNPDAVDQGVRRFVRYGNLYDEVDVFFYPKEKLSSHRLTILGGKASLISQLMDRNDRGRELDLRTNVDFVELLASATGNQDIYVQAKLTKKVKQLTALKKAHEDMLITVHSKLKWYMNELKRSSSDIEKWQPQMDRTKHVLSERSKGIHSIEIFGYAVDTVMKMEEKEALAILAERLATGPVNRLYGSINGFTIGTDPIGRLKAVFDLNVSNGLDKATQTSTYLASNLVEDPSRINRFGASMVRYMEDILYFADSKKKDAERKISEHQALLTPFAQEDELNEASAELKDVNARVDAWKQVNMANGGCKSGIDVFLPSKLFLDAWSILKDVKSADPSVVLRFGCDDSNKVQIEIRNNSTNEIVFLNTIMVEDPGMGSICSNDVNGEISLSSDLIRNIVDRIHGRDSIGSAVNVSAKTDDDYLSFDAEDNADDNDNSIGSEFANDRFNQAQERGGNGSFVKLTDVSADGSLGVYAYGGNGASLGFASLTDRLESGKIIPVVPEDSIGMIQLSQGGESFERFLDHSIGMTGDPFVMLNADMVKLSLKNDGNGEGSVVTEATSGQTFYMARHKVDGSVRSDQDKSFYLQKDSSAILGGIAGTAYDKSVLIDVTESGFRVQSGTLPETLDFGDPISVEAWVAHSNVDNFPDISTVLDNGERLPLGIQFSSRAAATIASGAWQTLTLHPSGLVTGNTPDGRDVIVEGAVLPEKGRPEEPIKLNIESEFVKKIKCIAREEGQFAELSFNQVNGDVVFPVVRGKDEILVGMPVVLEKISLEQKAVADIDPISPVEPAPQEKLAPSSLPIPFIESEEVDFEQMPDFANVNGSEQEAKIEPLPVETPTSQNNFDHQETDLVASVVSVEVVDEHEHVVSFVRIGSESGKYSVENEREEIRKSVEKESGQEIQKNDPEVKGPVPYRIPVWFGQDFDSDGESSRETRRRRSTKSTEPVRTPGFIFGNRNIK